MLSFRSDAMLYVVLVKGWPALVRAQELPRYERWPVLAQSDEPDEAVRLLDRGVSLVRASATESDSQT
jgi:hypothetical protein